MVKAHRIEAAASKYLTRMRRYSLADIPYKHCFANVSRPWPILGGASGKVSFGFIGISAPGFCNIFLFLNLDSNLRNPGNFLNLDLRCFRN